MKKTLVPAAADKVKMPRPCEIKRLMRDDRAPVQLNTLEKDILKALDNIRTVEAQNFKRRYQLPKIDQRKVVHTGHC